MVGGADDASTLVEIFYAAISIFEHVFLYIQKNRLFLSDPGPPGWARYVV
jgi:hypothetical protein